jgi:hypothetical protein
VSQARSSSDILYPNEPDIELTVRDDEGWFGVQFPEHVDELYCAFLGVITDRARLRTLFEIFTETLDQLLRIDAAADENPGVHL